MSPHQRHRLAGLALIVLIAGGCTSLASTSASPLAGDAKARKADDGGTATEVAPTESEPEARTEPIRTRVPRGRRSAVPEAGSQGDAG